ncbi:MAG TPA: HIT family protein [Acidobacteriota bacterium]|nr:HIT family protein [Acidobacteriota bacterium]
MTDCPFCRRIAAPQFILENQLALAFPDFYPVSPGDTLIVPRRHVGDFFDLTAEEQASVWTLAAPVRKHIEKDHSPDGYNLGVNVGKAAGQTVAHSHVHVIPRYARDVEDPRGGIRWMIPSKAPHWRTP